MIAEFIKIYTRDLDRLKLEIELFETEENLWRIKEGVKNSSGNLCLHLVGNLNTYIGKILGQTEYVRDREAEFNLKNVKKQELIEKVERTKNVVIATLQKLSIEELNKEYPEPVFDYRMTTGFFLIHLAAHLSYHLGQINYLRRMIEA